MHTISIHAPREGSDKTRALIEVRRFHFNPRSPRRERLCAWGLISLISLYFNPRSPRRERLSFSVAFEFVNPISIHAPREGSDVTNSHVVNEGDISIHAPREGSDTAASRWGCTGSDFNPRSPRRERPAVAVAVEIAEPISIHAPREGSDGGVAGHTAAGADFNPRSPRRERPLLHPESHGGLHFNPRSPRRERPGCAGRFGQSALISIHAPREGSDIRRVYCMHIRRISIHAPREGSDFGPCSAPSPSPNFNPRSPRRERPIQRGFVNHKRLISIHAPREGSDHSPRRFARREGQFQSTLPAKGATWRARPRG